MGVAGICKKWRVWGLLHGFSNASSSRSVSDGGYDLSFIVSHVGVDMLWRWPQLFVFCALFAVLGATHAEAVELATHCREDNSVTPAVIRCRIRADEALKVEDVSVYAAGNDTPISGAKFVKYDPEEKTSAWLFLVDRSDRRRRRTIEKIGATIVKLGNHRTGERKFAVGVFDNTLKIVAKFDDDKDEFDKQARKIVAGGDATELYRITKEAIEWLGNEQADRRALVILSDGKAEDKEFSRSDVIAAARKHGVVIYGVGYAERDRDTPDLQVLRRLAGQTQGPYVVAKGRTRELPKTFYDEFTQYLENGGEVIIPIGTLSGDVNLRIKVEFESGASASKTSPVSVTAQAAKPAGGPSAAPAGSDGEGKTDKPKTFVAKLLDAVKKNKTAAGVAGGGLLAMLFGAIVLGLKSRRKPPPLPPVSMEPLPTSEPPSSGRRKTVVTAPTLTNDPSQVVYGWFQFLDAGSTKVPITATTVRIGRHSDNDLRIANDSVHRQHAVMHMTPAKKFVIRDLGTKNGVYVNSSRQEQTEIVDGDVIELGEVRMRFSINPSIR